MYRYYCIMRPPMLGGLPFRRCSLSFEAFDERRYIPEIDRMAWGWVEFTEELTPAEISDYELIREPREDEMNNDLISRSALLSGYDVRKVTEYDESGCGVDYKAVPVEAIENAPAVDAEPVRHGRWTEPYPYDIWDVYRCSVCGLDASSPTIYCPACGTKMDLPEPLREDS